MTDMGPLHFCLGIQVFQDPTTKSITLSQRSYIHSILFKYHVDACNGIDTPLPVALKHITPKTHEKTPSYPYTNVLDSIQYLVSCTRLYICFTTNFLSRHMHNPSSLHVMYLKQLLRYLKRTNDLSLTYKYNPSNFFLFVYLTLIGEVILALGNQHQATYFYLLLNSLMAK
ncbi:hypothetical protein KP509_31G006200 [Ceratopteris richardii]|uniref:Reverse transcriptase Ty1/copia-type domain-containing protein n=1 Tax=Ceratopteris richardii TaxID=49495 RepID=A0A8T2QVT0_CERRI|nr:hypothetical protein KP509_31G006200 [Ceratopteris richardii]